MDSKSKKEKRIESKKRKARAFLELVKETDEVNKETNVSGASAAKLTKISNEQQGMMNIEDEIAERRRLMRERQKASMEKPKLYLLLDDLQFQHSKQMSEDLTYKELPPLFMLDLQHLLLYGLQGNTASYKPRWCRLLRVGKVTSVIVLVLDTVSSYELQVYPDCFPYLKSQFDMSCDMVPPEQYGSTIHHELFNVPLSNSALCRMNGGLTAPTRNVINQFTRPPGYALNDAPTNNVKSSTNENTTDDNKVDHPTNNQAKSSDKNTDKPNKNCSNEEDELEDGEIQSSDDKPQKSKSDTVRSFSKAGFSRAGVINKDDVFDRTSLLLNTTQMIAEDFPMPITYGKLESYKTFVYSKDTYSKVHSQSPLFAVDCEMCLTSAKKLELTRVSIVNEDLETIYDTFVKPYNPIKDYLSRFSGVTKAILDPVNTRLEDVQRFLRDVLPPDAILCGQSLKGDLLALQMFHPYVIDTSVIFNLSGQRMFKTSLKKLSAHFLGKVIQDSKDGHCSVEDSCTTMELVKLKLKNSPNFGDFATEGAPYPAQNIETDNKSDSGNTSSNNNCDDKQYSSDIPKVTQPDFITTVVNDFTTESTDKSVKKSTEVTTSQCSKNSSADDTMDQKVNHDCTCSESQMEDKDECKKCELCRTRLIQQRKSFFSKAGSQVYQSFFDLTKKYNKMVGLIDKPETLALYKDDTMTAVPTTCDRDTKSTGKSLVQFHDFVYMNFPSFKDGHGSVSEEEKMHILRKLDKRMSKVLKHVRTNSLVAVVMSGRFQEGQNFSAKTFVKVT